MGLDRRLLIYVFLRRVLAGKRMPAQKQQLKDQDRQRKIVGICAPRYAFKTLLL